MLRLGRALSTCTEMLLSADCICPFISQALLWRLPLGRDASSATGSCCCTEGTSSLPWPPQRLRFFREVFAGGFLTAEERRLATVPLKR